MKYSFSPSTLLPDGSDGVGNLERTRLLSVSEDVIEDDTHDEPSSTI